MGAIPGADQAPGLGTLAELIAQAYDKLGQLQAEKRAHGQIVTAANPSDGHVLRGPGRRCVEGETDPARRPCSDQSAGADAEDPAGSAQGGAPAAEDPGRLRGRRGNPPRAVERRRARPVADPRALLSWGPGPLAQLVEQGTLNPKVGGSSPPRPTREAPRIAWPTAPISERCCASRFATCALRKPSGAQGSLGGPLGGFALEVSLLIRDRRDLRRAALGGGGPSVRRLHGYRHLALGCHRGSFRRSAHNEAGENAPRG